MHFVYAFREMMISRKGAYMKKIKLGYAPTRRSIFSAPDAIKFRGLTADRLRELGVDFVDITDINEEGLLYDDNDVDKIVAKFKAEGVDGLLLAHCNFGTEFVCARLAKKLGVPVLLWGPLDERPDENGVRLRDTQCGLFATGKVLRRFRVPFTELYSSGLYTFVQTVLKYRIFSYLLYIPTFGIERRNLCRKPQYPQITSQKHFPEKRS